MPDLVRRAAVAVLGTFAVISVLASFVARPSRRRPTPAHAEPGQGPWYFLWLQEIVADTTFTIAGFTVNGAFLGGVILPGLLLALLTAWPWLDRSPARPPGSGSTAVAAQAERGLPGVARARPSSSSPS